MCGGHGLHSQTTIADAVAGEMGWLLNKPKRGEIYISTGVELLDAPARHSYVQGVITLQTVLCANARAGTTTPSDWQSVSLRSRTKSIFLKSGQPRTFQTAPPPQKELSQVNFITKLL